MPTAMWPSRGTAPIKSAIQTPSRRPIHTGTCSLRRASTAMLSRHLSRSAKPPTTPTTPGRSQPAACWAVPTAVSPTSSRLELTRTISSTLPMRIIMPVRLSPTSRGKRRRPRAFPRKASAQAPPISGHLNGKKGGQAQFGYTYDDSSQPTGSTSFTDSGSGVNFHSTQVTAATFDEVAHTATLTGSGTDNGSPVTFTIVAADSSLAPPGLFSITLSDGYNDSSNLLDGSVTVY